MLAYPWIQRPLSLALLLVFGLASPACRRPGQGHWSEDLGTVVRNSPPDGHGDTEFSAEAILALNRIREHFMAVQNRVLIHSDEDWRHLKASMGWTAMKVERLAREHGAGTSGPASLVALRREAAVLLAALEAEIARLEVTAATTPAELTAVLTSQLSGLEADLEAMSPLPTARGTGNLRHHLAIPSGALDSLSRPIAPDEFPSLRAELSDTMGRLMRTFRLEQYRIWWGFERI